ncbi:hypothetical protein TNCV_4621851 [Trichonephila clavipes]|nr:hypothetical protein TNCV_4621851 [Trichonephila clavipes]
MTAVGVFILELHPVRGWNKMVLLGVKGCRGDVQDKTAQYFKGAGFIARVGTIPSKEADSQLCGGNVTPAIA